MSKTVLVRNSDNNEDVTIEAWADAGAFGFDLLDEEEDEDEEDEEP